MSRLRTLAFVAAKRVRDLMMNDRHDQRAASASRSEDERTVFAGSMRPEFVLGGSHQIAATSSASGGIGARGQGFDAGSTAVLLPGTAIDGFEAVGGSPGNASYLRCGGCGATIALARRVRHDGKFVDYIPDSHESCGRPVVNNGGWGIDA